MHSQQTHQFNTKHFLYIFPQRHQFDAIFFPTVGFRLKLQEITDGGDYACHAKYDQDHEFDFHYTVNVDRELKKCRGFAKSKTNTDNKNAIDVTDTDASAAPILNVYKLLTAAKRKPHLITTKCSDRSRIVASKSMVRRTTGDGQSSIQKRHINSFDTSTVATPSFTTTATTITITTTPTSIPVLHSNKQHSTMPDIELSTTIPTTLVSLRPDSSDPMILPYSMGKRYGYSIHYFVFVPSYDCCVSSLHILCFRECAALFWVLICFGFFSYNIQSLVWVFFPFSFIN